MFSFNNLCKQLGKIFSGSPPVVAKNALPEAPSIPTDDYLNAPMPRTSDCSRARLDQMPTKLDELRKQHNIENVKLLSKGSVGMVYSANDGQKNKFALKVLQTCYLSKERIDEWANTNKRELYYLAKLRHENIVKYYGDIWMCTPVEYGSAKMVPGVSLCWQNQFCLALCLFTDKPHISYFRHQTASS